MPKAYKQTERREKAIAVITRQISEYRSAIVAEKAKPQADLDLIDFFKDKLKKAKTVLANTEANLNPA